MAHIVIDARLINSTTGRYMHRLVSYLQDIDTINTYTVLVLKKDELYWVPKPTASNFSVRVADYKQYSFAEQLAFTRFLYSLKPDLVHFCMPQQPILYRGKHVTTFHDLSLLKTYNSDKNWLVYHAKQLVGLYAFKQFAQRSNHIIAVSEYTQKELIKFYPHLNPENISVVYESSDVATIAPKKYQLPYKEYILYVGQQSDYKNIKRLGDAHQLLLAKNPKLGLVLVGKKNAAAKTNEAYFSERGYTNIHFTDFVSDAKLNWLYAHAKAYVFPSLMEGFGLPGLEAMGHGIPVVSSNATCLPEIYGQAAYYFNPIDTSDIATAIQNVLSDDKLRSRLSKEGYKRIKKYSWKKMAQQTHAIYDRVLGKK